MARVVTAKGRLVRPLLQNYNAYYEGASEGRACSSELGRRPPRPLRPRRSRLHAAVHTALAPSLFRLKPFFRLGVSLPSRFYPESNGCDWGPFTGGFPRIAAVKTDMPHRAVFFYKKICDGFNGALLLVLLGSAWCSNVLWGIFFAQIRGLVHKKILLFYSLDLC